MAGNESVYNATIEALCPNYTETEDKMVRYTAFWLDGVAKTTVAVLGVVSNTLAAFVLQKPKMKNSFNLCLVALACIDTIFLAGSILESLRKRFGLSTNLHMILYPQLLYPLSNISLTASIYLITAITLERYCAVHYPVDYRQAANDPKLMKRRMWRYLVPVLSFSIIINLSKFFELYVAQDEEGDYTFGISTMRRNQIYSAITNWMRLIFMSALPLFVIIYFNFQVYKDVKERSQRSFDRRNTAKTIQTSPETKLTNAKSSIELNPLNSPNPATTPVNNLEGEAANISTDPERAQLVNGDGQQAEQKDIERAASPTALVFISNGNSNGNSNGKSETRRAAEDKLAIIFLVIILGFVFCHMPRVAMDIHEILTLKHSNMCREANMRFTVPAWTIVAVYVSHFCLAVNATCNMFIYCFMSPLFRQELWLLIADVKKCLCQRKPIEV